MWLFLSAKITGDRPKGHLEDPEGPPVVIRPHLESCPFMSIYMSQEQTRFFSGTALFCHSQFERPLDIARSLSCSKRYSKFNINFMPLFHF